MVYARQENGHFTSAIDLITKEKNAHVRSIPTVNIKKKTHKQQNYKLIRTNFSKL